MYCIHCKVPIYRHKFWNGQSGWAEEDKAHRSGRTIWRSACFKNALGRHEPDAFILAVLESEE